MNKQILYLKQRALLTRYRIIANTIWSSLCISRHKLWRTFQLWEEASDQYQTGSHFNRDEGYYNPSKCKKWFTYKNDLWINDTLLCYTCNVQLLRFFAFSFDFFALKVNIMFRCSHGSVLNFFKTMKHSLE